MKSKFLTIILIIILIGIFVFLGNIFIGKTNSDNLASPVGKNMPLPTPTPIQYNFNKSTDLKGELDSINPEVLDSDFDSLKSITSQL